MSFLQFSAFLRLLLRSALDLVLIASGSKQIIPLFISFIYFISFFSLSDLIFVLLFEREEDEKSVNTFICPWILQTSSCIHFLFVPVLSVWTNIQITIPLIMLNDAGRRHSSWWWSCDQHLRRKFIQDDLPIGITRFIQFKSSWNCFSTLVFTFVLEVLLIASLRAQNST